MLEAKTYTLSELMSVIKESSDSKPVVGKNVWKDNSQNNVKAVKDIMKQTEDYNDVGVVKRSTNPENIVDYNKTTLDVDFAYEPSKEYKERVNAQVKGFPSVENEKLHEENKDEEQKTDSLDYKGNEEFYKKNSEKQKEVSKKKQDIKHAGLKSHNLPKEEFKDNNIFTESKKMKRLTYNKVFLNEAQVLKKIPDDYKVDGNKFIMEDINNVRYIIECKKDDVINSYIQTKVVKVIKPENMVNEEFEKIKRLSNYNSKDDFSVMTNEARKMEENKLSENINRVKELMKKVTK